MSDQQGSDAVREARMRAVEDAIAKQLHPFVCGGLDVPGVPECLRRARAALASSKETK